MAKKPTPPPARTETGDGAETRGLSPKPPAGRSHPLLLHPLLLHPLLLHRSASAQPSVRVWLRLGVHLAGTTR